MSVTLRAPVQFMRSTKPVITSPRQSHPNTLKRAACDNQVMTHRQRHLRAAKQQTVHSANKTTKQELMAFATVLMLSEIPDLVF